MPWPCSPGLTPNSDRPQTPSRTSASATPTISPSSSATQAPSGSVAAGGATRVSRRGACALALGVVGGQELGRDQRAPAQPGRPSAAAGTSSGVIRRAIGEDGGHGGAVNHAGRPARRRGAASATLLRRSWPSRSRSSRTAARRSVDRSTRSARPRSTRARSATARAARTASARVCGTYCGRAGPRARRRAPRPQPRLVPGQAAAGVSLRRDPASRPRLASRHRGRRQRRRPRAGGGRRRRRHRRRPGRPLAALRPRRGSSVRSTRRPASSRSSTRPSRSPRSPTPSPPRGRPQDASIVLAAQAVAEGRADALVSGGSTGAALAAGLLNIRRAHGIYRPALAIPLPVPGGRPPVTLLDVGANAEVRPEHLVQFAFMGAALAQDRARPRAPARRAAVATAPRRSRARRWSRRPTGSWRSAPAPSPLVDFVGNTEGNVVMDGVADVVVADGFTGNVALKLIEGVSSATLRSIREAATGVVARQARRAAAALRPAARCAPRSTRRPRAAPTCSACASSASSRTAASRAPASRQAILLAARGVRNDVVGQTHAALEEAGALKAPAAARVRAGALPFSERHDPRRRLHPDPQPPRRRARRRRGADRRRRRASRRTWTPTRSTCTRWCRSSRTPTGSR